jgi:N utilization substance protein B
MGARTTAREAALQLLYAHEAAEEPLDDVLRVYWRETPGDPEGRSYAEAITRGVVERRAEVDQAITRASQNWRLERMTRVDRNVLRIGTYELMVVTDVPRAVILDEAVELAKRFGTEESGKFVNGVLERIANDLGRSDFAGT